MKPLFAVFLTVLCLLFEAMFVLYYLGASDIYIKSASLFCIIMSVFGAVINALNFAFATWGGYIHDES